MLRRRNTEVKQKNREKWRQSDREIQELYNSNEEKIKKLEGMVEQLSSELARPAPRNKPQTTVNKLHRSKQGRQEWFGDPF